MATSLLASLQFLSGCSAPVVNQLPHSPRAGAATGKAGTWTRLDAETLRFEGNITASTAREFLAVLDEHTRRVIVNSGGGQVAPAVEVAEHIRDRSLELVIDGYCLSSCANYWSLASPDVTLIDGIIGFHGTLTGCVETYGGLKGYVGKDLPKVTPQERFDAVTRDVEAALAMEARFFGQKGIPTGLPVEYCRPDKGFAGGVTYSFIAPNDHRLRSLGVRLRDGHGQSKARLSEYNALAPMPILWF